MKACSWPGGRTWLVARSGPPGSLPLKARLQDAIDDLLAQNEERYLSEQDFDCVTLKALVRHIYEGPKGDG